MFHELIRQLVSAFSLTACIISLVFFTYTISKTRNLNPYLIFAMGTAKAVMSQKFRNILILMFFSTFLFFAAYSVKYFLAIRTLYWLLETLSLFLFLVAGLFGAVATLRIKNKWSGLEKNKGNNGKHKHYSIENHTTNS